MVAHELGVVAVGTHELPLHTHTARYANMVSHSLPHHACQQYKAHVIYVIAISSMDSASMQKECLI